MTSTTRHCWAGAAKVDITPKEGELAVSTDTIRDHLFVRAIVVDNGVTCAALVGMDLGGAGSPTPKTIADANVSAVTTAKSKLAPGCAEGKIVEAAISLMHKSGQ